MPHGVMAISKNLTDAGVSAPPLRGGDSGQYVGTAQAIMVCIRHKEAVSFYSMARHHGEGEIVVTIDKRWLQDLNVKPFA